MISQISKDAILGMPLLRAQGCAMDFGRPVLRMGERELVCTDSHGRVLVSRVQLLREITIPPNTEMLIQGRLNTRSHPDLGLIKPEPDGPLVAASLSRPYSKQTLLVRCVKTKFDSTTGVLIKLANFGAYCLSLTTQWYNS